MSNKQWRCFHCDGVFKTFSSARDHFGDSQLEEPACKIKGSSEEGLVKRIRELQFELAKFYHETTEIDRYLAGRVFDHAAEIANAEDKGYARGLIDAGEKQRDEVP